MFCSTKDNSPTLQKSNGCNGNYIVNIYVNLGTHLNEYGLCDDQHTNQHQSKC